MKNANSLLKTFLRFWCIYK